MPTQTLWERTKWGGKAGFDKLYSLVDKLGAPVNKLSNKLGSEAFWPTTLDIESDKAARILRSFCSEYRRGRTRLLDTDNFCRGWLLRRGGDPTHHGSENESQGFEEDSFRGETFSCSVCGSFLQLPVTSHRVRLSHV